MKRPIKPPTPPPAPPVPEGPTSGRARKEVTYAARPAPPLPSTRTPPADEYDMVEDLATPIKAEPMPTPMGKPQRPIGPIGAVGADRMPDDTAATPIKAAPLVAPLFDPTTGPSPPSVRDLMPPRQEAPTGHWEAGSGSLPTGPIQPIPHPHAHAPPHPGPPPSYRGPATGGFAPPASQHALNAASSGRVRQMTPMDTPMYPSQQGPISSPLGPVSGPHLPPQMMNRPPGSTGPFPTMAQGAMGQGPPSHSTQTGMHPPSTRQPGAPDEGVPLGYVVASAFFLAIALVGFGLYLAFEVISL